MENEHRVRITWSDALVRCGLLYQVDRIMDPVWLETDPHDADAWTLRCRFDVPPSVQGSPSIGWAHFLVDEAPSDWLTPGVRLRLFERGSGKHALVEVLD
jgi:hypothetical protein